METPDEDKETRLYHLNIEGITKFQSTLFIIMFLFLALGHSMKEAVVEQYTRSSFSKRMVEKAESQIKASSIFGSLLGCVLCFTIIAEIIPHFNEKFLTFNYSEHEHELNFHSMLYEELSRAYQTRVQVVVLYDVIKDECGRS